MRVKVRITDPDSEWSTEVTLLQAIQRLCLSETYKSAEVARHALLTGSVQSKSGMRFTIVPSKVSSEMEVAA